MNTKKKRVAITGAEREKQVMDRLMSAIVLVRCDSENLSNGISTLEETVASAQSMIDSLLTIIADGSVLAHLNRTQTDATIIELSAKYGDPSPDSEYGKEGDKHAN